MRRFIRLFKDERGATAVEYGMILAMVFLAMVVAVQNFADSTITMWNHVATEVQRN